MVKIEEKEYEYEMPLLMSVIISSYRDIKHTLWIRP